MIKEALWDGMGWMGLGWIVIIGRRPAKSTFGANNVLDSDQHKFTGWSIHINVQ